MKQGDRRLVGFDSARRGRRRGRLLAISILLVPLLFAGYVIAQTGASTVKPVKEPETSADEAAGKPARSDAATPREAAKAERGKERRPEMVARSAPLPAPAESCDDLRVLVDREHPLPPGYAPPDLVSLQAYGVPTLGADALLRREAAVHVADLVAAAARDGEELVVASAYRSYVDQQASKAKWAAYYGDSGAGGMSADPGHSQHQLGTAVDFTNAAANYEIWQGFGQTSASDWLMRNAPDHGFVLAYPLGREKETGYQWEPWHYRYVGEENVERMREGDLSLQAFLIREGVLPRCG